MEATKVTTNHHPAIRAVLLCFGDCSGEEIVMPVRYVMSSGIPLRWHAARPPPGQHRQWASRCSHATQQRERAGVLSR
jgi:hypothetical protein